MPKILGQRWPEEELEAKARELNSMVKYADWQVVNELLTKTLRELGREKAPR